MRFSSLVSVVAARPRVISPVCASRSSRSLALVFWPSGKRRRFVKSWCLFNQFHTKLLSIGEAPFINCLINAISFVVASHLHSLSRGSICDHMLVLLIHASRSALNACIVSFKKSKKSSGCSPPVRYQSTSAIRENCVMHGLGFLLIMDIVVGPPDSDGTEVTYNTAKLKSNTSETKDAILG